MKRINRFKKMMNKDRVRDLRSQVSSFIKEHGIDFFSLADSLEESENGFYWNIANFEPSMYINGIPIFRRSNLRISCDRTDHGYKFLDFEISSGKDKDNDFDKCFYIDLRQVSVLDFLDNLYRLYKIREYV